MRACNQPPLLPVPSFLGCCFTLLPHLGASLSFKNFPPNYKSHPNQPAAQYLQAWELISTTLKRSGVAFLTPKQAEAALRKGTPVVDIRPSNEFGKGRLPGATNCQFSQPIAGG